ncbi:ParA family protein [Halovenus marina]|uniref:ParA family protein n=1 Tax=Halovenus marina TaxID=3396621 RepID=UPI003F5574DA
MSTRTVAFVGAAGGVGTTRLTVECGALLARAGQDVAIFEMAFATQGLSSYVDEPIDADVTALATGEAELEASLYEPYETPGRLSLCPARGPFERVARAQTAGAASRLEQQFAAASLSHDVVLLDTPPVCSNQALAAVNVADRIATVVPGDTRGRDALARLRERFADVGVSADVVVANRGDEEFTDADVTVPDSAETAPRDEPVCLAADGAFPAAVADIVDATLGVSVDIDATDDDGGGLFSRVTDTADGQ